jgi:hypothetical protein
MMRIEQLMNVLVLSLFVLAGCTPVKPTGTAVVTQQSAASTEALPSTANSQTATPTEASSSPQETPTGQASQAIAGWQQYHSSDMGIKIAYPAGWSAAENKGEVTFTSPGGDVIYLDQVQANGLSPQDFLDQNQLPNTHCSSGKNPQGVQYRSCFDTIALSTSAYLVINSTQGSPQFFTLSTFDRGGLDIFNAMLASFQTA